MPRVAKFSSELQWYVPDIEDNRQDPDPMRVQIRPLSATEVNKHRRLLVRAGKAEGEELYTTVTEMNHAMIADCVVAVEGYELIVNGETLKPANGKELVDAILAGGHAEIQILDDIATALHKQSHLDEGLLKKPQSSSGSSPTGETMSKTSEAGGAQIVGVKMSEGESVANHCESLGTVTGTTTQTSSGPGRLNYVDAPGPK